MRLGLVRWLIPVGLEGVGLTVVAMDSISDDGTSRRGGCGLRIVDPVEYATQDPSETWPALLRLGIAITVVFVLYPGRVIPPRRSRDRIPDPLQAREDRKPLERQPTPANEARISCLQTHRDRQFPLTPFLGGTARNRSRPANIQTAPLEQVQCFFG